MHDLYSVTVSTVTMASQLTGAGGDATVLSRRISRRAAGDM